MRLTQKSGVKKDFLIEDALLHNLQALKEIPQDVMIPTRITLSLHEMERLTNLLENPLEANAALSALMAND